MKSSANRFVPAARKALQDQELRQAVSAATRSGRRNRERAMFLDGHAHGEALRRRAAEARRRALRQLPDLLEQVQAAMQANGIEVLWAETAAEARQFVLDIADRHQSRRVIKSKSMVSEEIGLNDALIQQGLEVVETDLGEFIIQLAGEPPSHIVGPVIHKSKAAIRDLFVRDLGMTPTDDAAEMTHFARRHLRDIFLNGDLGISGGNFLVAETGTLCLVTNEGNGRLVTTLPPVHIALVGIEKVVETLDDLTLLSQVLPRSATGQVLSAYTHLINGPRADGEPDGPDHVYVILVDNGRSAIYTSKYAEVLACIRCGACLNACPVYEVVGGHTYGWVYAGPIGAVLTPLMTGFQNASPLPHASSLCGECKLVCPVEIDLPGLLLELRHDLVTQGHSPWHWRLGLRAWATVSRSPRLFALASRIARWGSHLLPRRHHLPLGPLGAWTRSRDLPALAPRSFHQVWQQREKENRR